MDAVPAPMPFFSRVINTFFAPGRVGESLRAHRRWGDVLALGTIGGVLAVMPLMVTPRGRDLLMSNVRIEMNKQKGGPQLTDDQMKMAAWFAAGAVVFGVVFGTVVSVFVGAGIYWLLFTLAMGRDGKYMQYVAVVSHMTLIGVLSAAVTTGLQLQAGSLYAAPTAALLVSGRPVHDPLWLALSYLNLFAFWSIVAGGTMVGGVTNASAAKAVAALFGLYLAFSAVMFPISLFFARMGAGV